MQLPEWFERTKLGRFTLALPIFLTIFLLVQSACYFLGRWKMDWFLILFLSLFLSLIFTLRPSSPFPRRSHQ
jgi:hypothetical protein